MSKKNIIILIIILIIIGLGAFYSYKMLSAPKNDLTQSTASNTLDENNSTTEPQQDSGAQIEVQDDSGNVVDNNSLNVCVDQCGDGVCQTTDPECSLTHYLNCICLENAQTCPQDCQ